MRALVTGGAGFVGSNLCWELAARGWDVVALDDLSAGTFKNLQGFPGDVDRRRRRRRRRIGRRASARSTPCFIRPRSPTRPSPIRRR